MLFAKNGHSISIRIIAAGVACLFLFNSIIRVDDAEALAAWSGMQRVDARRVLEIGKLESLGYIQFALPGSDEEKSLDINGNNLDIGEHGVFTLRHTLKEDPYKLLKYIHRKKTEMLISALADSSDDPRYAAIKDLLKTDEAEPVRTAYSNLSFTHKHLNLASDLALPDILGTAFAFIILIKEELLLEKEMTPQEVSFFHCAKRLVDSHPEIFSEIFYKTKAREIFIRNALLNPSRYIKKSRWVTPLYDADKCMEQYKKLLSGKGVENYERLIESVASLPPDKKTNFIERVARRASRPGADLMCRVQAKEMSRYLPICELREALADSERSAYYPEGYPISPWQKHLEHSLRWIGHSDIKIIAHGTSHRENSSSGSTYDHNMLLSPLASPQLMLLNIMIEGAITAGDTGPFLGVIRHPFLSDWFGPYYVILKEGAPSTVDLEHNDPARTIRRDQHAIYLVPGVKGAEFLRRGLDEAVRHNMMSLEDARIASDMIMTYRELAQHQNKLDSILQGKMTPAEVIRDDVVTEFNSIYRAYPGEEELATSELTAPNDLAMQGEIRALINGPDFSPENLIALLKKIPVLKERYDASAGVIEGYTVEEHTLMVMRQFEKYFADAELPGKTTKGAFRVILALHDIGKPEADYELDSGHQHKYTCNIITSLSDNLPFSNEEMALALAIIDGDPLGLYFRRVHNMKDTASGIREMAKSVPHLELADFFDLLTIYYQVDASSYTTDSGSIGLMDQYHIFAPHPGRKGFAFDCSKNRIAFMRVANMFDALETDIKAYLRPEPAASLPKATTEPAIVKPPAVNGAPSQTTNESMPGVEAKPILSIPEPKDYKSLDDEIAEDMFYIKVMLLIVITTFVVVFPLTLLLLVCPSLQHIAMDTFSFIKGLFFNPSYDAVSLLGPGIFFGRLLRGDDMGSITKNDAVRAALTGTGKQVSVNTVSGDGKRAGVAGQPEDRRTWMANLVKRVLPRKDLTDGASGEPFYGIIKDVQSLEGEAPNTDLLNKNGKPKCGLTRRAFLAISAGSIAAASLPLPENIIPALPKFCPTLKHIDFIFRVRPTRVALLIEKSAEKINRSAWAWKDYVRYAGHRMNVQDCEDVKNNPDILYSPSADEVDSVLSAMESAMGRIPGLAHHVRFYSGIPTIVKEGSSAVLPYGDSLYIAEIKRYFWEESRESDVDRPLFYDISRGEYGAMPRLKEQVANYCNKIETLPEGGWRGIFKRSPALLHIAEELDRILASEGIEASVHAFSTVYSHLRIYGEMLDHLDEAIEWAYKDEVARSRTVDFSTFEQEIKGELFGDAGIEHLRSHVKLAEGAQTKIKADSGDPRLPEKTVKDAVPRIDDVTQTKPVLSQATVTTDLPGQDAPSVVLPNKKLVYNKNEAIDDVYRRQIDSASEMSKNYGKRCQSLILYADDIVNSAAMVDLEESVKKLLVTHDILNGGKIVLFAKDRRNAIVLEQMIKNAGLRDAPIIITQGELCDLRPDARKDGEVGETRELIKYAKTKGIKDLLGIIRGPVSEPEELEKFFNDSESKTPIIQVGVERAFYSFAQAIVIAMKIRMCEGRNGWLRKKGDGSISMTLAVEKIEPSPFSCREDTSFGVGDSAGNTALQPADVTSAALTFILSDLLAIGSAISVIWYEWAQPREYKSRFLLRWPGYVVLAIGLTAPLYIICPPIRHIIAEIFSFIAGIFFDPPTDSISSLDSGVFFGCFLQYDGTHNTAQHAQESDHGRPGEGQIPAADEALSAEDALDMIIQNHLLGSAVLQREFNRISEIPDFKIAAPDQIKEIKAIFKKPEIRQAILELEVSGISDEDACREAEKIIMDGANVAHHTDMKLYDSLTRYATAVVLEVGAERCLPTPEKKDLRQAVRGLYVLLREAEVLSKDYDEKKVERARLVSILQLADDGPGGGFRPGSVVIAPASEEASGNQVSHSTEQESFLRSMCEKGEGAITAADKARLFEIARHFNFPVDPNNEDGRELLNSDVNALYILSRAESAASKMDAAPPHIRQVIGEIANPWFTHELGHITELHDILEILVDFDDSAELRTLCVSAKRYNGIASGWLRILDGWKEFLMLDEKILAALLADLHLLTSEAMQSVQDAIVYVRSMSAANSEIDTMMINLNKLHAEVSNNTMRITDIEERAATGIVDTMADVNGMLREFTRLYHNDDIVNISLKTDESLPHVSITHRNLSYLCSNLLSNAHNAIYKAQTKGLIDKGVISISTRLCTENGKQFAEIVFTDNGIGMTEEDLARIRSENIVHAEGGGGHGMLFIKGIIKSSGGTMSIETVEGKGTSFTINLPLNSGAEYASQQSPAATRSDIMAMVSRKCAKLLNRARKVCKDYGRKKQSLILYADDIVNSAAMVDLEESVKKLLVTHDILNGGKIVLFAKDRRNAIVLEQMIKNAGLRDAPIIITQGELCDLRPDARKDGEVGETRELIKYAKTKGIKDLLGIIRGPVSEPEELEKFFNDSESKTPIIQVGVERAFYSFAQAIVIAMKIRMCEGRNGWLRILPPVRVITEDLEKRYKAYQEELQARAAA